MKKHYVLFTSVIELEGNFDSGCDIDFKMVEIAKSFAEKYQDIKRSELCDYEIIDKKTFSYYQDGKCCGFLNKWGGI